jgi:hypothetical protein
MFQRMPIPPTTWKTEPETANRVAISICGDYTIAHHPHGDTLSVKVAGFREILGTFNPSESRHVAALHMRGESIARFQGATKPKPKAPCLLSNGKRAKALKLPPKNIVSFPTFVRLRE